MAKEDPAKSRKDLEEEVWAAISAFEQILEAMPDDRASLEALSGAYEQIGDHARAKEYYVRLSRVLLSEGDAVTAKEVVGHLQSYAAEDLDVQRLAERLARLAEGEAAPASEEPALPQHAPTKAVSMDFNMADELSFTWNLMESKEITQEEYASIVQDLTEMSASESASTVSVLHVLEARGSKNLDRIIAFAAKHAETPYISLGSFDLQHAVVSLLPMDFVVRRGALVFGLLGKDAMAVVMNPYDKGLRQDVQSLAGRTCHFYLTKASEFDQAVSKITDVGVEKAAPVEEKK